MYLPESYHLVPRKTLRSRGGIGKVEGCSFNDGKIPVLIIDDILSMSHNRLRNTFVKLAYRCLILDHDDTAVDSTRSIHYPAYLAVMDELRPCTPRLSFDGWMCKNFSPGILPFLTDELGMNDREIKREYEIWRSFSTREDPPFFPKMLDFLREYRNAGGIIAVVSHSEADIITRNYRVASDESFIPDAIYGWELPADRRKPNPWAVHHLARTFNLDTEDILVVDDLKPGVDMARDAGVAVAGAGWAYAIPEIREYMESACDTYFESIDDLAAWVVR